MVTTRFKFVADACYRQRAGYVHMLERLPKDKSRSLLSEKIFGSAGDPCPEDCVDDVKEMIIKKCGGVPLAIVAVAGLLASKLTVEQDFKLDSNLKSKPRLKLAKNIWTDVCNSLSSELEVNLNPEGVTHILNLCYNDLQADQKTCLLYLTIFPKGCFIGRKRLIRRWIAEGFITEKHGKTMQEVADDYFNELYSRNVIRPVDLSSNGKVKTCQVHDMILEYLLSKSSEENFVTAVGGHWLTPTPSNKVRRLSLHGSDPSHAKEAIGSMNLSHVRSLSVFDNLNQLSFFKFGILQVLDLQGCKGLNMDRLKKICKMFQLKFLSLRKTDIRALPSRITKLRYLETLDIRETEVRQLATSIGRLQRMTHLLAGDKSKRLALKFNDGIAKMIALQTLSGIEICGSSRTALADMHNLTKLKKLSIYNLRDMGSGSNQSYEVLLSAILYLSGCSLNSLAIDDGFVGFFEHLDSLPAPPRYLHALNLSGKLCRLPQWISDLQNLEKLTLSLTSLRTDALKLLSALRTLFSLTFTLHAANHQDADVLDILQNNVLKSDGEIFVSPGGFDCLKLLRFSAPALPLLSFLQGAMPNLEKLELMFRSLTGAYGLENLKSLQQVVLKISNRASIAAKAKVGDIRKSISKLDNVPTVIVDEYFESM